MKLMEDVPDVQYLLKVERPNPGNYISTIGLCPAHEVSRKMYMSIFNKLMNMLSAEFCRFNWNYELINTPIISFMNIYRPILDFHIQIIFTTNTKTT